MTNGSVAITEGLLQRASLQQYVDKMMDVTGPRAWKPHAQAYQYAARELNLKPEHLMLVAIHPWDCSGAKQASTLQLAVCMLTQGCSKMPNLPQRLHSASDVCSEQH